MDYAEFLFDILILSIFAIILAVLLSFVIVALRVLSVAVAVENRRPPLTHLEQLLSEHQWELADEETNRIMLSMSRTRNRGIVSHVDVLNFPEETLLAIDSLWSEHSNGRFGFNIQRHIYIELGTNAVAPYQENNVLLEKLETFSDFVGWRVEGRYLKYEELTFDTTAPFGHLPACRWLFPTAQRIPSEEHRERYRAKALLLLIKRW